jgi:lipopolysaccharide/colanic/teichoic acid biosynthesis glycosyltransferase
LDEIVGQGDADEMYEKYVLKKKNALRIRYAKEVSFKTDAKLFLTTVWRVIQKALSFIVLKKHR